jgi:hypothetical protein
VHINNIANNIHSLLLLEFTTVRVHLESLVAYKAAVLVDASYFQEITLLTFLPVHELIGVQVIIVLSIEVIFHSNRGVLQPEDERETNGVSCQLLFLPQFSTPVWVAARAPFSPPTLLNLFISVQKVPQEFPLLFKCAIKTCVSSATFVSTSSLSAKFPPYNWHSPRLKHVPVKHIIWVITIPNPFEANWNMTALAVLN